MRTATVTGIILGHKNFGEFDKLIHLYSQEFGKIKLIAKGARKITSKFTGHLETLNKCRAVIYFGPKNIILTEIITIKNLKRIHNNLEKLINALKIAEITNKIIQDNQQLEQLNELLEETIKQLGISLRNQFITSCYFLKLLNKAGLIPTLKNSLIEQLKTIPFEEIEKIAISKAQEEFLKNLIFAVLNHYLKSSDLTTFTTPFTSSSLSSNKSN